MSLENESSVLLETPVESVDNVDVVDDQQEPPTIVTEQVSLPSELCTLCMDTRNDPVTLACSDHHTFCRKCLLQTGPPKCPMCRTPYKYTDLWNDDLYDPENEFHVQFKHALDTFGRAIINVTAERDLQERIRYEEELTRQGFLQNPMFENTLERRREFLAFTVYRQPIHIIHAFADRIGVAQHNNLNDQMRALGDYLCSEDTTVPTDVYQDAAYELMTHTEANAHTNLPPNTVAGLQAQLMAAFPGARITRVTPIQMLDEIRNMDPMPDIQIPSDGDDENNNQDGNQENQNPNEPLRLTSEHDCFLEIFGHIMIASTRQIITRHPARTSDSDFPPINVTNILASPPVIIASPRKLKHVVEMCVNHHLTILTAAIMECLSRDSLEQIINALIAADVLPENNHVINVLDPTSVLLERVRGGVILDSIKRLLIECIDNETIRNVLRTDPYSPLRIEDETDETVSIPPSNPHPTFIPDARNHTFVHTSHNLPDPRLHLPRINPFNNVRLDPTPQTESRMRPWYLNLLRTTSDFESENGAKFIIWLVLGIVSVCFPWTLANQQSMDDRNRSITYLLAFGIHNIITIANFLVATTYFAFLYQYYMVGISFGVLWLAINYLHTISIRTLVAFQRYYRGNEFFNTNPTNCIAKVKHYFSRI